MKTFLKEAKLNNIIREIYTKPELDWVNSLVDYIFDSPEISQKYLNKKYNIDIELDDYDDFTIIDDASYNPETNLITLYLNNKLDELINKNYSRKEVVLEFKRFIHHEMYHYQQGNNGIKKPTKEERQNRFRAFYNKELKPEEIKLLVQEVDAHSKNVGKVLQDNGFKLKDAIESLEFNNYPTNLFSKTELDEINLYKSHSAEWKRFLLGVYKYYELEK